MPEPGTRPGLDVKVLVRRFLEGELGVKATPLWGGLGFLCGPGLENQRVAPRLFAVATKDGVLLRLDEASRDRIVENEVGHLNAGLPEWVDRLEDAHGVPGLPMGGAAGDPAEWVWVPLADHAAFERRRPHIHEALAYCRYCILEPRTK